jgi:apolipoprotein N-acyltransferase
MYKFINFSDKFNIFYITRGFLIALLTSIFIYLDYLLLTNLLLNTIFALIALYMLLKADLKIWFWSGFFIAMLWFWWIPLSFRYYGFPWAIPFGILSISLIYGFIFWLVVYFSHILEQRYNISPLILKSIFLLVSSYIHPFGFDWFKIELIFINSCIGIEKWQFLIVLLSVSSYIYTKKWRYLLIIILSLNIFQNFSEVTALASLKAGAKAPVPNLKIDNSIELISTYISIEDKYKEKLQSQNIQMIYKYIEKSIDNNKSIIVFPESIIPNFLNYDQTTKDRLKDYAQKISIVIGALYLDDGEIPRNSTYIFTKNKMQIANKVVLVPFGEKNPLPDFLSDLVNKIFYNGAVDYQASKNIYDYTINKKIYRNAICFEATSERLYKNNPKNMIAISNNSWFTPSIEPTLQKLLLEYYSKKYNTTIYHSVNGSKSYIIKK